MTKEVKTRAASPTRDMAKEARSTIKKMVADAETRGYQRGLKAAMSIVRTIK